MAIFIHLVMTMTAMSWLSSSRSQLGRLQLFSSIGENLTATNHYQRTECVGGRAEETETRKDNMNSRILD